MGNTPRFGRKPSLEGRHSEGFADVAAPRLTLRRRLSLGDRGFVPAFVGLGAPYWSSDARALFAQINFSTTRAQMARSVTDLDRLPGA